jgi:hypothetical protein
MNYEALGLFGYVYGEGDLLGMLMAVVVVVFVYTLMSKA